MPGTSGQTNRAIDVFLADDNLIVREGVKALIERNADLRVVGVAADYDGVVSGCAATEPQVLVTDVRMPPSFRREGIDAAKEVRSLFPGTGVVILSQYDDPEYAVSLLAEGSAGYGYLLKDRVAEGTQLADAIRAVATGGTALDPQIVEALVRPVLTPGGLSSAEELLLSLIAEGRTIKAIAAIRKVSAVGDRRGGRGGLRQARHRRVGGRPHRAEPAAPAAPGHRRPRGAGRDAVPAAAVRAGVEAAELRVRIGETERVIVTVLMSDIRSYSTIAEHADPSALAGQLNTHRAAMNKAILGEGGTVMQFVGDAVMAVFGAPFPQPDHADHAVAAAAGMHALQAEINAALARRRAAGVRARPRAVHRGGGRRPARLGGAPGVHAGRGHGEPGAAAAAVRRGRRDGHLRAHQERPVPFRSRRPRCPRSWSRAATHRSWPFKIRRPGALGRRRGRS